MSKYYFLNCVFPPIELGQKPELSFEHLQDLLNMNLSVSDLEKVSFLRRYMDLKNLHALWTHKPLDYRGNFGAKELEEILLVREAMPDFVLDFLDT